MELFKGLDQNIVNLLVDMLQFNPHLRPTVSQCLKNPIFDKLRVEKLENLRARPFDCQVDELFPLDYTDDDVKDVYSKRDYQELLKKLII